MCALAGPESPLSHGSLFPLLQTQMALSFKSLVVDKFLFANEKEITIMTVCNHETYGITVSDTDALLTSQIRLGGGGGGALVIT